MGCLTKLIQKIIFIAILISFFAFGGFTYTKKIINDYQNPPRSEFVKTESNYGNFSNVSSDYKLSRCFNVLGFKKINATYLPTNQKITIYDIKDEEKISVNDFKSGEINNKITKLLDNFKDSFITFEDFKIVQKGNYSAKNKTIPYIKFSAKVKNVPFKNVSGIIAAYSTINEKSKKSSTKLIVTLVDTKAYNPTIINNFISAIKF